MGTPHWFIDMLRIVFGFLDGIIYWLAEITYEMFVMISNVEVLSPNAINNFAGRIYALLGIFMLFKVSFSLITYILNPDTLTDKSKGLGKLLTNFFVALIGIVAVPYIFRAAFSLQAIVLEENVIGNIVLGGSSSLNEEEAEDYIKTAGSKMSYTILSAFVRLNPNAVGQECANNPVVINQDTNEVSLSTKCTEDTKAMTALNIATNANTGDTVGEALINAYKENNTSYFTSTNLLTLKTVDIKTDKDVYLFEYVGLVSTIAGGFLAWTFLMFCIDIAVRGVKLAFLQLVAPIPIISYIDPKGQNIFQKWLKECAKTYADLFVRLLGIYFVIFMISELFIGFGQNTQSSGGSTIALGEAGIFVKTFFIIGLLMFAKQIPELISNILGIKMGKGNFNLNPVSKLQQVPVLGAAATGLVGRGIGAITAARNDQTGNRWRSAASGWFAAGDSLKGKVKLGGNDPGSQSVNAFKAGREAGYKIATGNEIRKHSWVNDMFKEDGANRIADLKNNYRAPLQQELNNIGLQKQEAANAYNRLNEQLQTATSDSQRATIRARMQQVQERYRELSTREAKVSGDIGVINDQIKDLERAYNVDKSPVKKVDEVKGRVDTTSGHVREGAYGETLEPIDYSVPPEQTRTTQRVVPRKVSGNGQSRPGTQRVTVRKKGDS